MFRRVGGYLCLMSMLINLEGNFNEIHTVGSYLSTNESKTNLNGISSMMELIELIFKVLAISMRYEPSNAKHFSQDV